MLYLVSVYMRSVEMVRVTYLDATRIKRLREAGEPWSAAGSTFKRIFHVLGGLNRCRTCSLSVWIRGLADVSSSYVPKESASGGGVLLPSVSMIRREVATWRGKEWRVPQWSSTPSGYRRERWRQRPPSSLREYDSARSSHMAKERRRVPQWSESGGDGYSTALAGRFLFLLVAK